MTFGVSIHNEVGDAVLTLSDTTYALVDMFTIAYGAVGSKTYTDFSGWNFVVTQTQDADLGASRDDLDNFSWVTLTLTYPGGIPTVSWGGWSSVGAGQPINVVVLGN